MTRKAALDREAYQRRKALRREPDQIIESRVKQKIDEHPIQTICPYCGSKVIFTSNAEIYGKEYGNGKCYKCTDCDAYVGVHTGTRIPLGSLANYELRELRKEGHRLFDGSRKGVKGLKRHRAYGKLATLLGIPINECHFGWFGEVRAQQAIEILQNPLWYKGVPWNAEQDKE